MQNFKREEQNFVIQNEINNLAFLTEEGKAKMSKVKTQTQSILLDIECHMESLYETQTIEQQGWKQM